MDMKKLEEQFNKEYEFLYNAPGYVEGYNEAVTYFDQLLEANPEPIREFARYRGDVVSSDREAAAFVFAYTKLGYDKETQSYFERLGRRYGLLTEFRAEGIC